ncbi:MAG TPA: hypothetical protein VMI56_07020 [Reyranella sp.]|nr:hypothetical protein [Reyranella sp.]
MAKAKAPPAKPDRKNQDQREAETFRRTLKRNKQVVPEGQPLSPGATHVEGKDAEGRPTLVRKRFSAI